ncbi:MAG: SIR2 family protein [Candidatus Methanomethylophilaceae archaeon]|nr:SIR2 family protein [Candidatus Methanomethylophilaceae archaeon]
MIDILNKWDVSIITTNYDVIFDEMSSTHKKYHSIYHDELEGRSFIRERFILHIHGSVEEKNNMVLTEKDYFRQYYSKEKRERMEKLMEFIFNDSDYTILFIGSGMSELEILQFMMQHEGKSRVFCLEGYLRSEQKLCDSLGKMFKGMNVTLLPYCMDEKGHDALLDVL